MMQTAPLRAEPGLPFRCARIELGVRLECSGGLKLLERMPSTLDVGRQLLRLHKELLALLNLRFRTEFFRV